MAVMATSQVIIKGFGNSRRRQKQIVSGDGRVAESKPHAHGIIRSNIDVQQICVERDASESKNKQSLAIKISSITTQR